VPRLWASFVALLILAIASTQPACADKRVALVIGNNDYLNLGASGQLLKAVNDAETVGGALEKLGFKVIRGANLGRQGMIDKLAELTAQLEPGDTVAFFYAGHGVAIGGVNYLVPSDVPAVTGDAAEVRVRGAAIAEGDVVAELLAKSVRVALLVLDACRDNPFPRPPGTRSIGNARGLADIRRAPGVFTIYSAGIGQTALDQLEPGDPNRNSVFTRIFIDELTKPGVDLAGLAITVREQVAKLAREAKDDLGHPAPHEQTPAYYDQTVGRFYFGGPPAKDPVPPPLPPPDAAAQAWAAVKDTKSISVLEDFIRQFGGTIYASLAAARIEELKLAMLPPVKPVAPPVPSDPCGGGTVTASRSSLPCPLSATQERALTPREIFKECAECPEMVVVPVGSFMMGSPADEPQRNDDEGPQHKVTFANPFAVGRFAVTFDEWDACFKDGGCGYEPPDEKSWGRGRRPVINVSWNDAKRYVAWLSRKTGKNYRLLSEAEREYVTRAGTSTAFWTGSTISTKNANYNGNFVYRAGATGDNLAMTLPVESFAANPWGLYQVHGNVWEWVEDCWHEDYNGAPTDGSVWSGGDCNFHLLRGGSWFVDPRSIRSAARLGYSSDNRNGNDAGFRVARTLGELEQSEQSKRPQTAVVVPPVKPPTAPVPDPCGGGIATASRSSLPCALSAVQERALKPKDTFKECAACPEMVVVPAGSFMMGSPADESQRKNTEGPQHRVTFAKPFAVGRFSVTFDEWDACVSDGGCAHQPSDEKNWGRERRPVINVSWNDAKAYVVWLSRKTGRDYRLLSEAEREYVTRAGTTTVFWTGPTISTTEANYNGNFTYGGGVRGDNRVMTVPVDKFAPNPWGLFQVHGNVWEWVADCWHPNYAGAPTDGSVWEGGDCAFHLMRGGSWWVHPRDLRAAARLGWSSGGRHSTIGFRVARTLTR
jgi:formylglycine-generating enzyme required for sulfatase activity